MFGLMRVGSRGSEVNRALTKIEGLNIVTCVLYVFIYWDCVSNSAIPQKYV